jgi:hypothetical protein
MVDIVALLQGGDRRSIGRSDEVAAMVLADPTLFAELFEGLSATDPLVRMRAADAAEKITLQHPKLLKPFKSSLLKNIALIKQQEVRWHVAQMIPRLDCRMQNGWKRCRSVLILDGQKKIGNFSLQAMATWQNRILPCASGTQHIESAAKTGSPVKSR